MDDDRFQALATQLEDSVQMICEQISFLREEVEELKKEIREECYPRVRPQGSPLSAKGMEALERLARIRRESIL